MSDSSVNLSTTVPVASRSSGDSSLPATRTIMIIIAVLVVLTIVVIVAMWWRRYHSRPDCTQYTGSAKLLCMGATLGCGGNAACLNAVAQCVPLADDINNQTTGAGRAAAVLSDVPRLAACSAALSRIPPQFVKKMAATTGAATCVPATFANVVHSLPAASSGSVGEMYVRDLGLMKNAADAVAPVVPWALSIAQSFPTCPATPTTTGKSGTTGMGMVGATTTP